MKTTQSSESRSATASMLAVITAVAASACCIGPTILLALGVGGLGFASALEPYRLYFLALTAFFLGGAFYMAYRPVHANACSPNGGCSPPNRRRMRAGVWTAAVAALIAGAYPRIEAVRAANPVAETGVHTVLLDIEGMTCSACERHIRRELEKVPGVRGAVVEYASKRATIELEHEGVPTVALLAAVERAGYEASIPVVDQKPDDSAPNAVSFGGCCASAAARTAPATADSTAKSITNPTQ
jgi:mercuric ion transport protein